MAILSPVDVVWWKLPLGVVFNVPTFWAWARRRWTLANTALRSAVKAWPTRVVRSIWVAIAWTTSGKTTIATKLASNPDFTAASCSAVPLSDSWPAIHSASAPTLPGFCEHRRICASSWSGYRATGARR